MKNVVSKLGTSAVIAFAVWALWAWLEIIFYGEVQPRMVDDVMGLILMLSLYWNVEHWLEKE